MTDQIKNLNEQLVKKSQLLCEMKTHEQDSALKISNCFEGELDTMREQIVHIENERKLLELQNE